MQGRLNFDQIRGYLSEFQANFQICELPEIKKRGLLRVHECKNNLHDITFCVDLSDARPCPRAGF